MLDIELWLQLQHLHSVQVPCLLCCRPTGVLQTTRLCSGLQSARARICTALDGASSSIDWMACRHIQSGYGAQSHSMRTHIQHDILAML